MLKTNGIRRHRQQGVAAVEFAIILPVLITLLVFPIFFGRLLMHYTVLQKTAHNTAVYLATLPRNDLYTQSRWENSTDLANQIIEEEVAELNPGNDGKVFWRVSCDNFICGLNSPAPQQIQVQVALQMYDDYFNSFTALIVPEEGIRLTASVTVPYIGK